MSKLRKGMWVVYTGNGVGILNAFNPPATEGGAPVSAEVHLTESDGTTRLVLPTVPLFELRQARYSEIPEARRPEPAHGAALGYA